MQPSVDLDATSSKEPPFLTRVRLCAQRTALWQQHQWAAAPSGFGLSISAGEVARILRGDGNDPRLEQAFYENDPEARALRPTIEDADAAVASDAALSRLRQALDLSRAEVDLLTLAVSIELDPWLRRVYGYLHDDATSGLPTPWLARQVFQWPADTSFGPGCALLRWRLARPIDGQTTPWSAMGAWSADPFAVACLTRGITVDPVLGDGVELFVPSAVSLPPCLYPSELTAMHRFVRSLTCDGTAPPHMEIVISAANGAGKRMLARQLADTLDAPLLIVDAGALIPRTADAANAAETSIRVARSARLAGAAIYWHDVDLSARAWRTAPAPFLSILSVAGPAAPETADGRVRRTFHLPPLSQAARASLWSSRSPMPVPSPVVDWPLLPADIVRAVAAAPAGIDAVLDACKTTVPSDSGPLASPLARPYVADDLVVTPTLRRHLDELEAQARLRWVVYEEWGFGRLCPMGRGITAMFAGPSGTGKTMAAQVLARSLGTEIHRVDLSGVMSKYIGETEKHLRQVFDACERSNVLLFFDEADALFGQRMEVKDAHDRFANIEIDYLLQRMEQFEGISILATNRKHEIDPAFLRRLRFIIDFLPPGLAERRELWARALPARAPNGDELLDGVDFDFLAQRLTMTGADIKGAAMAAAFLACSENSRISMTHVMRAARRALARHGVVVRAGELDGDGPR